MTLARWEAAAVDAMAEVGEVALGAARLEVVARRSRSRAGLCGAFVALVGPEQSVQIGVESTREGCVALTRRLLCIEPGAVPPTEDDVTDAMREITNMVAGGMRTAMQGVDLRLGLPMFVHGHVSVNKRHESAVTELLVGGLPLVLVLLRDS